MNCKINHENKMKRLFLLVNVEAKCVIKAALNNFQNCLLSENKFVCEIIDECNKGIN